MNDKIAGEMLDKCLRVSIQDDGLVRAYARVRLDSDPELGKALIDLARRYTGRDPYYRHGNARLMIASREEHVLPMFEYAVQHMTYPRKRVVELALQYLKSEDVQEMASLIFEINDAQAGADLDDDDY